MCGVCGVVDYSNSSVRDNRASVERMVTALHHRGPDFHDMWIQEPALLGHSRLAVIDLSSGANQPMQSEDGRYVLVFNGEIYNFKDLRRLLVFRGVPLKQTQTLKFFCNCIPSTGMNVSPSFQGCLPLPCGIRKLRLYL